MAEPLVGPARSTDPAGPTEPVGPARRREMSAALAATGAALLLALAFLVAPPLGTDLSAQVARANFAGRYGGVPIDFGWYGGTSPYGYSLVTPTLMSWLGPDALGPRIAGALALVVAAAALAALFTRTAAARPMAGGLLGAACIAGNLVSGRITFAVGVACGLLALLALTVARRWLRWLAAAVAAFTAAAASPVAGLFVGLAGAALVLVGLLTHRAVPRGAGGGARAIDGVVLAVAAALPTTVPALLFGPGGWMNLSALDAARAVGAALAVALLVPRRAVRVAAVLSGLGVTAAFAVHTPVGLNATRLAAMFALPVLVAYGRVPERAVRAAGGRPGPPLAAALVVVAVVQPPVSVPDLRGADEPSAARDYFQPLLDELARRPPGRIEVVPTANYWEAAYVPEAAPLARGWLRQADQAHNRLFLDGSLDADSYAAWLRDDGVSYVALAGVAPSWVGRREAELIRAGLPYLTEVWRGGDWALYAVTAPGAVVEGARLVRLTARELTFDVPVAGETLVRVRWSRWLTVDGPLGPVGPIGVAGSRAVVHPGCLAARGDWTVLRIRQPGRYTISSSLTAPGPRCPAT